MTSKSKIKPVSKSQIKSGLDDANASGNLSNQAHGILVGNLATMDTFDVQHIDPDVLDESGEDRVTLVVPIIDETGSRAHQADLMREETNKMLDAFKSSSARDTILVSTWTFGERPKMLHGFVPLGDAEKLTRSNYDPDGLTALYDSMLALLTITEEYANQLLQRGYRVKVVIPIYTDGDDNVSRPDSAAKVQAVIRDLMASEIYRIGIIAFGTGYAHDAAAAMGIAPEDVREFGSDEKDIRAGFGLGSSSVIRQSQTNIGGSTSFFTN